MKARFVTDAPPSLWQEREPCSSASTAQLTSTASTWPSTCATLVGQEGRRQLLRVAAMRHVLAAHNAGVVGAKFLEREPDWPQKPGQRLHVSEDDARRFLLILTELASAVGPH